MKKIYPFLLVFTILFNSCKKESGWDAPLNGKWVEVSNFSSRALPSNCNLEFDNGIMIICGESVGKDLNHKSEVHARDGQVWISYRLSFRKHEEYRYDYQFEGEYLWIMEETTSNQMSVIRQPGAKKYRKL